MPTTSRRLVRCAPRTLLAVSGLAAVSAAGLLAPAAAAHRTPATAPVRVLAQSVSFPSATRGWLLGAERCAVGWCTVLRGTADRGRHWTAVAAPPAPVGQGRGTNRAAITELVAADVSDLFAYGPGLYMSHDAGAHWSRGRLPGAVVGLAAGDGRVYAVVMPCYQATGRCAHPGRLYQSPVGRDAWGPVAGVSFPAQSIPEISVHGAAVALVVGGDGSGRLLGAADGTQFAPLANPCPGQLATGGYTPGGVALSSAADLAVLCVGNAGAGSASKAAFVSATFGRSYRRIGNPPLGGDPGELVAATATTLMLTAESGATWLYRTTGPDVRWTAPIQFGDGGVGLSDVSFSDPLHGAVVYGQATTAEAIGTGAPRDMGSVLLTDTGGRSWFTVGA